MSNNVAMQKKRKKPEQSVYLVIFAVECGEARACRLQYPLTVLHKETFFHYSIKDYENFKDRTFGNSRKEH